MTPAECIHRGLPMACDPFGKEIDRYRTAGSLKFGKQQVTRNPHLSRGAEGRQEG